MVGAESSRVAKKRSKACGRCRAMKVRCSGQRPCGRCLRQNESCIEVPEVRRVLVPESYLVALENGGAPLTTTSGRRVSNQGQIATSPAAGRWQDGRHTATTVDHGQPSDAPDLTEVAHVLEPSRQDSSSPEDGLQSMVCRSGEATTAPNTAPTATGIMNPFRLNPPDDPDLCFRPAEGQFWYLAPSSSWAFCRRVLGLLGRSMPPDAEFVMDPFHTDGQVCKMEWYPLRRGEDPDVSDLPPLDLAIFWYNAARYYFGLLNHLVDDKAYHDNLNAFYADPKAKARSLNLWYAQHLLVMAFGKTYVSRRGTRRGQPAGHAYALRAMSLLPNQAEMGPDPLLAVQVLVLAAVYLQSVDMRVAAFQYIGQASRLCVCLGMHRHMPKRIFGEETSRRYNNIFWVVHIMDTEFSALMGASAFIKNEQITAKLPSSSGTSLEALNMSLHVRLSRLMATILTTVYSAGRSIEGSLVKDIQSNLRTLAQISSELHDLIAIHFEGSIPKASRDTLRLLLSYHHCVVLTTRPLVMRALHQHLEQTSNDTSQTLRLQEPVASILRSCVDSARTVLQTLRGLCEEDLIDCFQPFDLEDAFSAAFLLSVLRDISPSFVPDQSWRNDIDNILSHMVDRGSVVAPLRQREIQHLSKVLASIPPRFQGPSSPTRSADPDSEDHPVNPTPIFDLGDDFLIGDSAVGPSSNVLLDWAEQLDMDGILAAADFGTGKTFTTPGGRALS